MNFGNQEDTICALSTPNGVGAIALIRLSGKNAVEISQTVFSKQIDKTEPRMSIYGRISDGDEVIDEVVLTVFRNPASYTGEDTVEIACHGSIYIQQRILNLLISKGARMAKPGEFSLRAYLNGKMDLSQTEAVADLISAGSKEAHRLAMHQMRGGFGQELILLRQKLLDFASLIELELDFSQEDVEFADRTQLNDLISEIQTKISSLANSFQLGNVIKNGVPVAIVGPPNAGKSTLLNALLKEDKAIVSEVAGTTRDVIDDTIVLDGIEFRFIDTAGIRDTSDKVENIGIERAFEQIRKARIILLLIDAESTDKGAIEEQISKFKESVQDHQELVVLLNKSDNFNEQKSADLKNLGLLISAKQNQGLDQLVDQLLDTVRVEGHQNDLIVTNARHHEILVKCSESLNKVEEGLNSEIAGDLLAMDIREVLNLLGDITGGSITNDELLGNIFSNFCIGK